MKDFKRYFNIPSPPEVVYLALTNPVTIQLWTGEPAEMSTVPGSEFSMWNGSISGKNLKFEEGKMIMQQWYFGDHEKDSIVIITLLPQGTGSSVELTHTNIPDEDYEDIVDGRTRSYFGSLREFYRD